MEREVVIRASDSWGFPDWRALVRYRDLLYILVRRDLLSKYTQTILGPAWHIVQPLLTALLFSTLFGRAAKLPTEGVPPILFYLSGLLAWGYFAQCLDNTSRSLLNNIHLFQKIYFPRVLVPLSIVVSKVFTYGIQLGVLAIFIGYYHFKGTGGFVFRPSWSVLLLPLLLLQTSALALGVGLWTAALSTRYRDIHHLMNFVIQIWMYSTPIIYPLSLIHEEIRFLVLLNPMTSIIENHRVLFFQVGGVSGAAWAGSIVLTLTLLVSGLVIFHRIEKKFIDTL